MGVLGMKHQCWGNSSQSVNLIVLVAPLTGIILFDVERSHNSGIFSLDKVDSG